MTNQDVINFLNQVRKMLLDDKSWLESTIQPINEAFDKSISALQAQDSSVDLFPDLTIVEKAEIRGYVKGQLDAINDLVAAGLIERELMITTYRLKTENLKRIAVTERGYAICHPHSQHYMATVWNISY